jgi:peroxiredoxin
VVAVSVDTIEENVRLAERLGLEFPILSDVQEEAGGGAISRPAIFLIGPDGTISWRRLTDDYRVRVRPEDVLEALSAAD